MRNCGAPSKKILLVDDDTLLISSVQRNLGREYDLTTCTSPADGLDQLAQESFAVIVSDMHMPRMSGIDFLMEAQSVSPDSIRVMITGRADLSVALTAINDSHIFRFLVKPVSPMTMRQVLDSSLRQYHLVIAERDLLSKTLVGSVQVLLDILRRVYPNSFQNTHRIRAHTRKIVDKLKLTESWRFELAAILAPIGLITAPEAILHKLHHKKPLSTIEQRILLEHIEEGRTMLSKIPRLEQVAEIIGKQNQELPRSVTHIPLPERDPIMLGAQILQLVTRYDYLIQHYQSEQNAIMHMGMENKYDPILLDALRDTVL